MLKIHVNSKLAEKHFYNVKDSIQNRIKAIIQTGHFKYSKRTYNLNPRVIQILEPYLNDDVLFEHITCLPEDLNNKARKITIHSPAHKDKRSIIYKLMYRIFVEYGYDVFNKLEFINDLNIQTCPYCNRNYIYSLDNTGLIKPEIDHFYPKGIYPFLAASYYNLIPSCQTCNGFGGKGEKDTYLTGITSPYLMNGDEFEFSYNLISLSYINPLAGKSQVDIKFSKHLQPHFEVFKLDKLYEKHWDHVLELVLKKTLKYNYKYRLYLNSYHGLKFSNSEIDRMILGNYSRDAELHKRPLSILYRDIGKKLGLI